jgi:hypothetical protein
MAPIFAQMGNDAVGASLRGSPRRAHRIGKSASARISDGGDMIDIHPKAQITAHDEIPPN